MQESETTVPDPTSDEAQLIPVSLRSLRIGMSGHIIT